MTEEERWAIVEYLKSIPEEAGRVTPFGGPPDAKTGHGPWVESLSCLRLVQTIQLIMEQRNVRPYRWAKADRRSRIDLTDLFAFTSPENAGRTVLAANVFPSAGTSAMFSNAINHSIVVRRATVAGPWR